MLIEDVAKMREFSVSFLLNEEQEERLQKIWSNCRDYQNEAGEKPFEQVTIETVLNMVMLTGTSHHIDERLELFKDFLARRD